jgi:hypothetical protein
MSRFIPSSGATVARILSAALLASLVIPGTAAAQDDELAQIREATAQFQTIEAAEAAGYELGYVNGSGVRIVDGCVANPEQGAMGYHYINPALMEDLVVDPLQPEALVYAPMSDGGTRLVAAEYIVRGEGSDPPGATSPPEVLGVPMHIIVPAVGWYTQHAWVWDYNPSGVMADWNPLVTCPTG